MQVVNDDDAEEEEEEDGCERRGRDRHRHSELIKLGAAGAGKSGKIGVCVTTRFIDLALLLALPLALPLALLLASSFSTWGVYISTPCSLALKHATPLTKAAHSTH